MQNTRNNKMYRRRHYDDSKERAAAEERAREEELQKNLANTEENFPSLGGGIAKPRSTWGGKKFTELASEWKKDDDDRKIMEEIQATDDKDEFVMPKFNPTHRFVEPEYEKEECQPAEKETENEDEWTTVDRTSKKAAQLARKQKRLEEKMKRMDDGEEHESEKSEEEDTCWNDGPAAHETCWDERP